MQTRDLLRCCSWTVPRPWDLAFGGLKEGDTANTHVHTSVSWIHTCVRACVHACGRAGYVTSAGTWTGPAAASARSQEVFHSRPRRGHVLSSWVRETHCVSVCTLKVLIDWAASMDGR